MEALRQFQALYLTRQQLVVLALGFSSGVPLLLVFSTLSFWLKDVGLSLAAIGAFALVRLPYTFKFLWAPLIDKTPLPWLTKALGRRRSWALVAQICLMLSIMSLALSEPAATPEITALFAILVAFSSATQDIVIDAYRIESLTSQEQGAGAGTSVMGYRLGLLVSGAGALWMATFLPWPIVYMSVGVCILVGVCALFLMGKEPLTPAPSAEAPPDLTLGRARWFYLSQQILDPLKNFISTHTHWIAILLFIALYKLSDAYLGAMANPFYVEMGFTKGEIASVTKVYGLLATILGGLLGGWWVARLGLVKALFIGALWQGLSNLTFLLQLYAGNNLYVLMGTITLENLAGGMGTAAFVALLSTLCQVRHTATQYALLSAIASLTRDLFSATSGWSVETLSWGGFFIVTTLCTLPSLVLLKYLYTKKAL